MNIRSFFKLFNRRKSLSAPVALQREQNNVFLFEEHSLIALICSKVVFINKKRSCLMTFFEKETRVIHRYDINKMNDGLITIILLILNLYVIALYLFL